MALIVAKVATDVNAIYQLPRLATVAAIGCCEWWSILPVSAQRFIGQEDWRRGRARVLLGDRLLLALPHALERLPPPLLLKLGLLRLLLLMMRLLSST